MLALLVTHNLNRELDWFDCVKCVLNIFSAFTVIFDVLGRLYTLTALINFIMLRKPVATMSAATRSASVGIADRARSIVFGPMSSFHHDLS